VPGTTEDVGPKGQLLRKSAQTWAVDEFGTPVVSTAAKKAPRRGYEMVNGETCKKNPQSATSIFRKLLTCHWHHDPITFDLSLPSDCLIAEARCV